MRTIYGRFPKRGEAYLIPSSSFNKNLQKQSSPGREVPASAVADNTDLTVIKTQKPMKIFTGRILVSILGLLILGLINPTKVDAQCTAPAVSFSPITYCAGATVNIQVSEASGLAAGESWVIRTGTSCGSGTVQQTLAGPAGSPWNTTITAPTTTTSYHVSHQGSCGGTVCTNFTITVDNTPPAITSCNNISQNNDVGQCDRSVDLTGHVTATDACTISSTTYSGGTTQTFPVGNTSVTATVTDNAGNTSTCSFTVTINDNEDPSISCPSNITANNDGGNCSSVQTFTVTTTDNCPGATQTQIAGLSSGAAFPVGVTTNTFVGSDGTNTNDTCSFTVTITDNEKPTISCPSNITQNTDAGQCDAVVTYTAPTGTDNCAGAVTTASVLNQGSGATYSKSGSPHTETYIVTDTSGNSDSCSFTITVQDNENPTLTCPSSSTVNMDAGQCDYDYTYTVTGTDNCNSSVSKNSGPGSYAGTTGTANGLTAGGHTFQYVNNDGNGQSVSCTWTLTVADQQNPTISCPSNDTVTTDVNECVHDYTATVSGTDNCSTTISKTSGPGSFTPTAGSSPSNTLVANNLPKGTSTFNFQSVDGAGNSVTCSWSVTVRDKQAPTWSNCPSNQTKNNLTGNCGANANWTEPSHSDNCSGSSFTQTHFSGNFFNVGTTTVMYIATDAANDDGSTNSDTCSFTVTVNDAQNPLITGCPSNITQGTDNGVCTAVVTWNQPSSSDNCPGDTLTSTHNPGNTFALGTTTVTYTAEDTTGNTSTCSFTVTVQDNENPQITCPSNITGSNDAGVCTSVETYTAPVGTDNCTGVSTSQTSGLASGANYPVGVTTNVFTVTDGAANTATCSFTVTIADTTDPAITCPSNISVNNDGGQCNAVVSYTAPVGTDNCTPSTSQTGGLASGATYPIGVTTNTFQVSDGAGNTATCSFTVTVTDNENPALTCPSNQSMSNLANQCYQVATYTPPTGTDNCAVTTALTSGLASGSNFPVGVNTVVYTATDANSNTTTCSFTITVTDTDPPNITCPSNATANNDGGNCSAAVTVANPTINDNCGTDTTWSYSGVTTGTGTGNASGTFNVGVTTVQYNATDGAGLSISCSFTVTVSDNEAPNITCPSNITTNTDGGACTAAVTYSVTHTDNCPSSTQALTSGPASGGTFNKGTTTVSWTATDAAANTATCSFTVTVNDNEAPTATCPSNQTVAVDGSCNISLADYTGSTTTSDNCPGETLAQSPAASTTISGHGTVTTVTMTVTDAASNTNTCTFTVTNDDQTAPAITCPSNMTANTDAGQCTAVVTYTAPIGTDNCTGQSTALTSGQGSGGTFALGVNTETYTVTDGAGNTATCSFTVTVSDNEAPAITCPSNMTVNNDASNCSAVVTYTPPVGTDNCTGQSTALTAGNGSGGTFNVGTTTETYTVTDGAGNTAACSFTITVLDAENPAITCPSNITVGNDASNCSAVVTYTAPVGTDNCPSPTTVGSGGNIGSGGTFPKGISTETYTVTDGAGNTATCSFTVTVNDTEAPTITSCPSNISQSVDAGQCNAIVSWGPPSATDNCLLISFNSTHTPGTQFAVGTTTVTYTATDNVFNTSTCQFTVTVVDDIDPAITCPSNVTVSNDGGNCDAAVTIAAATSTDNCSSTITNSENGGGANASDTYSVGTTTVTYTATDPAGNTATCSITVTVNDTEDPTITCPSNITGTNDVNVCTSVETYATPSGSDNCPGQTTTQTSGLASGAAFPVGTTTNTFKVTDAAGNTADCSFTVTITDTDPPSISGCPGPTISANVDAGTCHSAQTLAVPTVTDNCSGVSTLTNDFTGTSNASGNYPVGTTTVTYTATDPAGATATCQFTVTVTDNENPAITCPSNITTGTDGGSCDAVVSYSVTHTDNCPSSTQALTSGTASGGTFSVGTTTNTWTATDASGNTSTCSFTVTVNDNENPSITCPSNKTVPVSVSCDISLQDYTGAATTSDNCPGETVSQTPAPSTTLSGHGTTQTVTLVVSDGAANTASCTFVVTLDDQTAPTIFCPGNVSQGTDGGVCTAAITYSVTTTDNCGSTLTQDMGMASGASFPLGTTTNSFTVTDVAGNTATCSFTVTISDNEAPTVACPSNQTLNNTNGACGTNATWTIPTGSDNCGVANVSGTHSPGSFFPIGTTTASYTATDNSGNTGTCSFTITVNDTEAPSISCPANITQSAPTDSCSKIVNYIAPSGNDNCGTATTSQTAGKVSGSSFAVGTTTNTFTVTDGAGNTNTCSFTVTINDNQLPTISCPSNMSVGTDAGVCTAVVTWTSPSISDNCSGASMSQTAGLASGATHPTGVTTNNFLVTDASGNSATCSFTVTVSDDDAPSITCPTTPANGTAGFAQCFDVMSFSGNFASATDNCTGSPTITNSHNAGGADASGNYPVGTTTVTFTADDGNGNSSTCSVTVTVDDSQNPAITCPAGATVSNDAGQCDAAVSLSTASSTDNCSSTISNDHNAGGADASGTYPVGTTTVTFTATDPSGNTSTCSITVTVNDTESPSIACPSGMTASNDAGQCSAVVTYTAPTGTDNCPSPSTAQTNGLGSGSAFPVGATTEEYTVTDGAGNTAVCSFTILVVDTENPTITCPSNMSVSNDGGNCSAVVTYTAPTGTDNCPSATTALTSGNGSGGTFGVGTSTEVYTVTDASGNTASCSFTITVTDSESPTITSCPSNITKSTTAGSCDALVSWGSPNATDNCLLISFNSTHAPGSVFNLGTTTVTYTATDNAFNTATCVFTVTVNDNEAPSFTCPTAVTANNDAGNCSAVVTYTTPTATDNCGSATVTADGGNTGSGNAFPVGTTLETFYADDGNGNMDTCTFSVVVTDTELPAIACPSNITQNNDVDSCNAVVTYTTPAGTDNCPSQVTTLTAGIGSGGIFPVGTTTESYMVTDASGNTATCSFTVTINDNEAPAFVFCPTNFTVSTDAGVCDAAVTIGMPTFQDNCSGGVTMTNDYNNTNNATDTYPKGTTTVTFTITDPGGNSNASCSFDVTVNDNENPMITCPSNMTVNNDAGNCDAVVSYTAPTGTDNCPGASTALTSGQGSGGTFALGTNTEEYTVTDAAGNTAMCTFTVTVIDAENPAIACPANITQSNDNDSCNAVVTYTAPVGTDNCPSPTTSLTSGNGSGSIFPVGTTTEEYTVVDGAGNSAVCTFTVTVEDNQQPTITCAANQTQTADTTACTAAVTVVAPTVTDNCSGPITLTNNYTGTNDASGTYPKGTTVVTWTATDPDGNLSTCIQSITVTDDESPVITGCPSNMTQSNDSGQCGAVITWTPPTATDNCGTALVSNTHQPNTFFTKGTTTVTYIASDLSNNSASCVFTVTVNDTEAPTIANCPSNKTVSSTTGQCGAQVNWAPPSMNDNCSGGSLSGSHLPLDFFNVGTTTVTYTGTDGSGNTSVCTFDITVNDNENPVVNCPVSQETLYANGTCIASVPNYAASATTSDNCGVNTLVQSPTASTSLGLGSHTVTLTVTDVNGNSGTCTVAVTVSDTTSPFFLTSCPMGPINSTTNSGLCESTLLSPVAPPASDNCTLDTVIGTRSDNLTLTDPWPVGTTVITWTAYDSTGNTATCSQNVIITDTEAPMAVCQADTVWLDNAGLATITGMDIDGGSSDNCGIVSYAASPSTFTCSNVGNSSSTLTVTDAQGNIAVCSATVVVIDDEAPVISCPSQVVVMTDSGNCSAVVNYTSPSASDNCSGTAVSLISGLGNGSTFQLGTSVEEYHAVDPSGNADTCQFTVQVIDGEAPMITCPNDTVLKNDTNFCAAVLTYSVTGADNCGVTSVSQTIGQASGTLFPKGQTTNTWVASDAAGNTSTCTFKVTVTDNQGPTMSCPTNMTISTDAGMCVGTTTFNNATAFDNCPGPVTVTQTGGGTSGSQFSKGMTTVSFSATDTTGNTSSCSFTVTVEDNEDPVIASCPSNISVTAQPSNCSPSVNWTPPTASDNCGISSFTSTDNPGDNFSVGTTSVTYTAMDSAGNSVTCSFNITVTPMPLSVSLTPFTYPCGHHLMCNGDNSGSISSTVTGGCEPYTYSWSTGASTTAVGSLGAGSYTLTVTDNLGTSVQASVTLIQPDPIQTTIQAAQFVCTGANTGWIDLSVIGGANCLAYSYSWTGPGSFTATTEDLQNIANGTYMVNIFDVNGCLKSDTVTVSAFNPALVNLGPDDTICAGDTLVLDAGAGMASYSWNNGATTQMYNATSSGMHIVNVVDTNGCTGGDTLVLNLINVAKPNIVYSEPLPLCQNDTAALTATSGYSSYLWSGSSVISTNKITKTVAVASPGGDVYLTVTDQTGCDRTDTIQVAYVNEVDPNVQIKPDPAVICDGTIDTLDAGGGYFSYLWNGGQQTQKITISATGLYWVEVTNGFGCGERDSTTVTSGTTTPVAITKSNDTLYATAGFVSYQWQINGINISGAQSQFFVPTSTGQYTVIATNADGCESTATFDFSVGIDAGAGALGLDIFPNPSSGMVNIRPMAPVNEPVEITVVDMYGKILRSQRLDVLTGQHTLDLTDLAAAMYVVTIKTEDRSFQARIVIE